METERIEPAPLGPVVQLCSVGGCFEAPAWRVFAAYYDVDPDAVHPALARYPAAMFKACPDHLSMLMTADAQAPFCAGGYFVEPIR